MEGDSKGLQRRLGKGLADKLRSGKVQVRSGSVLVQVLFSLQLIFFSSPALNP